MAGGYIEGETIVSAAILVDGKVWTLPAPARHHNVIRNYCAETGADRCPAPQGDQGFVTSTGRFVRRAPAAAIALKAGQVEEVGARLYSEDVW